MKGEKYNGSTQDLWEFKATMQYNSSLLNTGFG